MTINNVPKDVIATGVVPHLPLEGRNSLMRTSKAFMAACQSDPAWEPMVKAWFLMRKQGESAYQTFKGFGKRVILCTNLLMLRFPQPAPTGIIARISSLFREAPPKTNPFTASLRRLRKAEKQKLYDNLTFILCNGGAELGFEIYRRMPGLFSAERMIDATCEFERYGDDWQGGHSLIALELAKSSQNNKQALWSRTLNSLVKRNALSDIQMRILEEVLSKTELSVSFREDLIVAAAEHGNLQAVKALLQTGKMTNSWKIDEAINAAKGDSQAEIIRAILGKVSLTDEEQWSMMMSAVESGHVLPVRELLSKYPISSYFASKCYEKAADWAKLRTPERYQEIMEMLKARYPDVAPASAKSL